MSAAAGCAPSPTRPSPAAVSTTATTSTAWRGERLGGRARKPSRSRRSTGASRCSPSAISTVANGRLYYRGRDAVDLAGHATLEQVAALLWSGFSSLPSTRSPASGTGIGAALVALARRTAADPPSLLRTPNLLQADASSILSTVADAVSGPGEGPLHLRLASHFDRPAAADDIRAALVLLADHELNASTFAARVTVSTGASFAAGALAGLAA